MEKFNLEWDMDEPLTYFKTYPKNSMIPAITKGADKRDVVSMMMIANPEIMEMMNEMAEESLDIETTIYSEDAGGKKDRNLVVRFDMFFPHAHTTYEGVVHNVNGQQKEFVKALEDSNTIDLWVTDENRRIEKVIPVKWEKERAKKILDNFK